ncbi:hypothetical protein B0H67DRAFT_566402 [Lasiosphaeris hirsuta]|uniref:Uncharacterized protein n=1 Tax=Lasiosphaeris hirsuta TaxID=260670 RepID=A0AA40BD32_9PEZI|nr:hypothetical protein B0H67DRAFT_566402 [Lasiosphaeris hirsuta]
MAFFLPLGRFRSPIHLFFFFPPSLLPLFGGWGVIRRDRQPGTWCRLVSGALAAVKGGGLSPLDVGGPARIRDRLYLTGAPQTSQQLPFLSFRFQRTERNRSTQRNTPPSVHTPPRACASSLLFLFLCNEFV